MPHHKPMVSATFDVPVEVITDRFVLRPLQYADAEPDYEAWRSSVEHLRGIFGPHSTWPTLEMSLQDNAIDLAWHQREHESRSSFAYTVFDTTNTTCLGCVYISPSRKKDFEVEVFYWARTSELQSGLDDNLGSFVHKWLEESWPFKCVVYPGRELPWSEYEGLEDREHL